MFSIARRETPHESPTTPLILTALALAGIAAIPTAMLGGTDALSMMGLGVTVALATVLAGSTIARFALRGPDRFGVKLVVGGFMFRIVLLILFLAALVRTAHIPLDRFVLWLVFFYFSLVMAEAWILARRQVAVLEETPLP